MLGVNRSGLYYEPAGENEENLRLMRLLDEQYTRTPFYGSRKMTEWLVAEGYPVNRKRVTRLMELLGIEAVYPKPKLSQPGEDHRIYPYLLGGTTVDRVNQVWSTDITYIRMAQGFVYLVAVMDWFSRFVLSWSLSLTLEVEFCVEALKRALRRGRPDIFNSDQGSQFTSEKFTGELAGRQIAISMDGRGRCMDNIFVERLWRSLKYEEVYLKDYASVTEARAGIAGYFRFYNHERLHQSLDYRTPAAICRTRKDSLKPPPHIPPVNRLKKPILARLSGLSSTGGAPDTDRKPCRARGACSCLFGRGAASSALSVSAPGAARTSSFPRRAPASRRAHGPGGGRD